MGNQSQIPRNLHFGALLSASLQGTGKLFHQLW